MNKSLGVGAVAFCMTVAVGLLVVRLPVLSASDRAESSALRPAAAVPKGETITIPTVGLTVVRPPGWSTITAAENIRNIRSVEMDDPELQELAARYSTTPIVAFAKYKEPYDNLNPSLKINVRSLGAFAGHAPEDILEAALPTFNRMFGDLHVEVAPTRTTLSGKPAAHAKLSYTLRAQGRVIPTISEIWVVPSGPIFFMIGTGTRADETNGSRAEVHAIVESIKVQ